MNIVTTAEYEKLKIKFLHKHKDWEVDTSPMDSDGIYDKIYKCADGANWIEVRRPVKTVQEIEYRKAKCRVSVDLLEIEGWSTDNSKSIFCYEQW